MNKRIVKVIDIFKNNENIKLFLYYVFVFCIIMGKIIRYYYFIINIF